MVSVTVDVDVYLEDVLDAASVKDVAKYIKAHWDPKERDALAYDLLSLRKPDKDDKAEDVDRVRAAFARGDHAEAERLFGLAWPECPRDPAAIAKAYNEWKGTAP